MNILYQYPLLAYALRMTLIPAVCYGYYQAFLRGRSFHTYNRTFLLTSTLLALTLPLIHIPWLPAAAAANPVILVLSPGPAEPVASAAAARAVFSPFQFLIPGLYILVASVLLLQLARSIYLIIRLARRSPSTRVGDIRIFETAGTYAPFSFLNWLFWDPQMDPAQGQGRLIFLHESLHIHHRHTWDILGMELLKAICWFNPFFWWTSKELKTLHEFAADRYALTQKDTYTEHYNYAELLVWQSVERTLPLTHSFFNNQLKRRIHMITQTSRRTGPLARIMALPLLLLLTALFTTTPGHTQSTTDAASAQKLLRWFNRHLRYPEGNLSAGKEGSIRFTLIMSENGKFLEFTPLDQRTPEQPLQRITVTSRPATDAGMQMPNEEATKHFMDDAKDAAEKINSPHPRYTYVDSVAAGRYYFEIDYKIEK